MDENSNTTETPEKKSSSTPKMLILGIIVVALLGIGGYFFLMNDNDQDDMTNSSTQTAAPTSSESMQENKVMDDSTSSEKKTYTLTEVAKHNSPEDCWLVIKGNVYDVTAFIKSGSHPGGSEILKGCGIDATELYTHRPGSGTEHSQRAYEMLPNYLIGTLAN